MLAREGALDDSGTVHLASLPPEARATIGLIVSGGPFPYRKDGSVFSNRERRLPRKPYGYYHEYTVPTPGSRDRAARRIISGQPGELYYTYDHYRHLQRIIE
ncbi:MAG: ribonuclease domain-containing protein [Betaproteobacteria bacterium]